MSVRPTPLSTIHKTSSAQTKTDASSSSQDEMLAAPQPTTSSTPPALAPRRDDALSRHSRVAASLRRNAGAAAGLRGGSYSAGYERSFFQMRDRDVRVIPYSQLSQRSPGREPQFISDDRLRTWLTRGASITENMNRADQSRLWAEVQAHVLRDQAMDSGSNGVLRWILHFILDFVMGSEDHMVLQDLGIKSPDDLKHLTPQQAAVLSQQIAQDIMAYDHAQAAYRRRAGDPRHPNDLAPAEAFFADGQNGVCRNYADVCAAIFNVLKEQQDPHPGELVNCYMTTVCSNRRNLKPDEANHMWNALVMVQDNGDIVACQLDPTWDDTDFSNSRKRGSYSFGPRQRGATEGARYFWFQYEWLMRSEPDNWPVDVESISGARLIPDDMGMTHGSHCVLFDPDNMQAVARRYARSIAHLSPAQQHFYIEVLGPEEKEAVEALLNAREVPSY